MNRQIAGGIIIVSVAIAALCLGWTVSKSAAEPIQGSEPPAAASETPAAAKTAGMSREESDAVVARFKQRDFDGALKLLKESVKKNPDSPPAELLLARLFAQANIPNGVRNSLEQATVAAPTDPEAYVDMGDILLREGWVTSAELLYRKAGGLIAKFDKSAKRKDVLVARIFSGLSLVDEARKDWAGSQTRLEAWLNYDKKSTAAMQRLARCMFQQKNVQGALEKLREAAKAEAELLTPEAIVAQYYAQMGDRENARKWFDAALKAAPKDIKTRVAVCRWALDAGQMDFAQSQAAAASEINAKSFDAMMIGGLVELYRKDYAAAERHFEAAHLDSPHNFAASNNLALALVEQNDEGKKRRALEYAVNNMQQTNGAEAAATYGWVLYKLGRLDEAEKALQAAISGGPVSPDTAYYIARLNVDRGREAQARDALESALRSGTSFSMQPEAKALLEQLKK
jgi:tetratricopeptide (TPR) repeat protein